MLKKDFNIKKNFLRVKQRADQGLGRAEKTEVLSSDLQNAEKKVEVLKTVVQSIIKRLTASLQAHGIQDAEKRTKKMPIVHLANSLLDNSNQLVEGVLSDVFSQCADSLLIIGNAQQTYELLIEKTTLAYFQQLLDVDVPAIRKSKQILSKLTLDMDATRSRQQAANKESSLHPSTHNQTKSDTLNNDLEDAEQKVAACKDQYATEMFTFLSKESEICLRIVELMDAQLSYYRSSVTQLEDLLPEIKSMIGQHSTRPVYGCPLEEHLQTTGKEIASVIETCVSILYHSGLEEEGLFRIAGSATQLKKLKAAFNVGTLVDMDDYFSDYHVVAGALKQYIRELPEPLLTFLLFDEFLQCMSVKNRDSRLQQLWTVVNKLPKNNFDNVKYLIKFLSKLAEKSEVNKMSPGNIAIVFGPNLLWDPNDDGKPNVVLSAVQNQVVETLVTHHDYFFPGDIEFADVESVIGRQSSVENSESEEKSPPADASNETVGSAGAQVKPAGELFVANDSSLSASQHSLASTDSGASSILSHSPSVHRKSKKPAPPPPPSFTTQTSYKESTPAKPERPERHASVKKPDVPPPGPPKGLPSGPPPSLPSGPPPSVPSGPPPGPPNDPPPSLPSLGLPIAQNHSSESSAAPPATQPTVITTSSLQSKAPSRPSNPPPPTPPATNTTSATYTPVPSANPFLDTAAVVNTAPSMARSLSDDQNTQSKKHSRNASADIPASQTAELKGHNRTKSHDLKLRQPPPIPQRTHSIPTKHSPEQKRLMSASKDSSPSEPVTSEAEVKLVDVVSPSKVSNDVIQEVEAGEKEPDDEYRIRMNSVTDDTSL